MGLNESNFWFVIFLAFLLFIIASVGVIILGEEKINERCQMVGADARPWYSYCIKEIDGELYKGHPIKVNGEYKFLISD